MTPTAISSADFDQQEAWFLERTQDLLRRTVTDNPFIPDLGGRFPSTPQELFLTLPADEILYGGAAGGGKSAALLAAALQYVEEPGYDALIVRRSYADLEKPGGLIPLSLEWLASTAAEYDGQQHRWYFPAGATLSFGHIQNEASVVQDYQGSAFGFIGFDELTQFSEFMYRYLFSRKRKASGLKFPTRVRATSNPGGVGHEWVKQRFIDAADGVECLFIPAKLEDNPGLDKEDYEQSLAKLDPVTRQQLRHGDWNVRPEGNLFKRDWFKDKIIDRLPGPLEIVRRWDLAATKATKGKDPDYASGCALAKTIDGRFIVCAMEHFRESPRETERRVIATANRDGKRAAVRIEQEPGAAAKLYIDSLASRLSGFDVRGVPSVSDKVTRAKPASAACERGDVFLLAGPWVNGFLDELCAFPNVDHDDQVDAFTGAFADLTGGVAAWDAADWGQVFGERPAGQERDGDGNRVRAEARGDGSAIAGGDIGDWQRQAEDDETGW